jgi:hypothetical protein
MEMAEKASWDLANREKIIKLRHREKASKQ